MYLFCKRNKEVLLFITALAVLIPVLFSCGGGGGGYDAPTTTQTGVLISAETLKGWIDGGKVNATGTYDRVVILDVSNQTDFNVGHIPGSFLVNWATDIYQTRNEGVIPDTDMVPDGPTMDALIQKYAIDRNTTIVFTSATGTAANASIYLRVTRAYFTFRYWGFPKERLKILDGLNAAYSFTYPGELTNEITTVSPSTYSVKNNPSFGGDLRASLQDMINLADGDIPNALIIDGRGATASCYDGTPKKTTGVFTPNDAGITTDYVAFEGHIKGAQAISYGDLFTTVDYNGDTVIDYRVHKPDADLAAVFGAIGLVPSTTAYVHCRTGNIASTLFAALDMMGWKVQLYDASWSQWGQLAGVSNGGYLPDNSTWRTDTAARSEVMTFNNGYLGAGEGIENPAAGGTVNAYDITGNRIEEEDSAYYSGGTGGDGGGGAPGY